MRLSAVERTFTHQTDTAGQQVAEFPDAQTAVRASKVLEAWHRDCAGRVHGQNVQVRPITDVAVANGTGWWYLVSFERRGTGHFHSLGLVLSGHPDDAAPDGPRRSGPQLRARQGPHGARGQGCVGKNGLMRSTT